MWYIRRKHSVHCPVQISALGAVRLEPIAAFSSFVSPGLTLTQTKVHANSWIEQLLCKESPQEVSTSKLFSNDGSLCIKQSRKGKLSLSVGEQQQEWVSTQVVQEGIVRSTAWMSFAVTNDWFYVLCGVRGALPQDLMEHCVMRFDGALCDTSSS